MRTKDESKYCSIRSLFSCISPASGCNIFLRTWSAAGLKNLTSLQGGSMATANHAFHHVSQSHNEWAVNYNQNDVDTIREQILQTEAMKRRWLVLILIGAIAALVGAIALLSTNYALYSSSESSKKKLQEDNASLKSRAD